MSIEFPTKILRPELDLSPAFTVSEVPHRAKLDQNESPFDVPQEVKGEILAELAASRWNRYPQPAQYAAIKLEFATALGLPADRVVITAGCDQMILLAYWAAGGPGRTARFFEPTYPMFGHFALITSTSADRAVLGPELDVASHGLGDPVDLLLLVTPNNPTGDGPNRELVLEALERDCLVFVDEAYADFDPEGSMIDLVADHPNLLVGRSLSKSALAGARLGYGVGHPDLIRVLERLLFAPYHLSSLQLAVARHFGSIRPHLADRVAAIRRERDRVHAEIAELSLRAWPSRGNFLMFEVVDAKATYQGLLDRGVRIRDVSGLPGLTQHLRVTIGTPQENELFLEALAAAV
ncbi:MAG: histidinol-phosphate aminotransferase family protein [Deltaproteobacteria bacterium]|nr:histidinol-phosphate aminotransferase family protein [Deltaproteobacteria bacterium]